MEQERLSLGNRWVIAATVSVALIFVVSAAFGFVFFPSLQRNVTYTGLWSMICSAAGQPQPSQAAHIVEPTYTLSNVMIASRVATPSATTIGRGATLALRCTMCHGAQGLSEANSPNLAGQYDQAIFKQLIDFQTGARASAVMEPLVHDLTADNAHELSAYYAYLPRPPWANADKPAPTIVAQGAPMRGIAPCGACHGSVGHKPGAPWLEGEPVAYLRGQMLAFRDGTRHNDIEAQMRIIARAMTDHEIDEAAHYYGD